MGAHRLDENQKSRQRQSKSRVLLLELVLRNRSENKQDKRPIRFTNASREGSWKNELRALTAWPRRKGCCRSQIQVEWLGI